MSVATERVDIPATVEPTPVLPDVPTDEERISVASQWQLVWWRFRKHKIAMASAVVVALFYVVVIFADAFAYADPYTQAAERSLFPPQRIHLFDDGGFRPFVHPIRGERDFTTFQRVYVEDTTQKLYLRFFAPGFEYKILGVIPSNIHVIGLADAPTEGNLFLLGADLSGRDLFSRLMYATQTSLTIGLIGVTIGLLLGVFLGGISGYYGGGFVDTVIQRLIEILQSVPAIPLWMGLAAAVPRDWSVLQVYFAITIILAFLGGGGAGVASGWTALSRVVRGRILSLRNEDFVKAAELAGASTPRIIFVHMVPLFMSHIIAATTLAFPAMIISETALSFLGLGLRPPAVSWGVLLQQAQNIQTVALSPWLMVAAVPVTIIILAFNFLGDGLRDAADPYGV
jgi:peptide/nickel transport system permease protein